MHRLDVVRIELPPLRTRRSDIPLLAQHFLAVTAQELKLPPKRFSRAALKLVAQRDYPGNVRELENLCRRLAVIAPGSEILPADLGGRLARWEAEHGSYVLARVHATHEAEKLMEDTQPCYWDA